MGARSLSLYRFARPLSKHNSGDSPGTTKGLSTEPAFGPMLSLSARHQKSAAAHSG